MLAATPGARLDPVPLEGDVADAAARVAQAAGQGPGVTLWGGETTVRLTGSGKGGRNQELALRVALALEGLERPWAFLSGGTDGRDGPTDAAGGLVDGGTAARARASGLDPVARLAGNDSHPVLEAAGDLLRTGATGTNVADLQVLCIG
jgi:hydroxypyruvate reductase